MDRKTLLLRLNQQRQRQTRELIPSPTKEVVTVSDVVWQAHQQVRQYQQKWRTEQTTLMLAECRQRLLHSIIGPFGLGSIVSAWDKVGGNVDTIHNVRSGVYATEEEQVRYEAAVSTTVIHTISTRQSTRRPTPKTVNRMQAKQWMPIPDRH